MQYAVNITHCQALESQHKAPIAIAFGICLALGVFCSYIPQIGKIIVRRSSLGIAFLYLITASFQNYASTLNVVMVSMPDLVCCSVVSAGTCGDLLLPVFQIGSPVFQLLIVYVLFLVFHPSRMAVEVVLQTAVQKTEDVEVLSSSSSSVEPKFFSRIGAWVAKHEFGISLLGFIFYIFLALIIFSAIGLYIDLTDGDSSSSARFYARVMGFVAVALNIAQWAPQIWITARSRHVGSLSIIMLALQTPGGLLIVFYNSLIDPSDWSTWLPFIFSSSMQLILLILCLVFTYRDRQREKAVAEALKEGNVLPHDERSPLLMQEHNDLK